MENSVCVKVKPENMREKDRKGTRNSYVLFNMATHTQLRYKGRFIY